jgi:sporulation protein YlmC with PRC-barrel domain
MKRTSILMLASMVFFTPAVTQAQVAGSSVLGVEATELRDVTLGWSAKRQVLGEPVFNDKNERIGTVDDIVIAPNKAVSYAIIGAGGFLALGVHDVVIPVNQLKLVDGKLVLPGATKEALMNMPRFEYAQRR